MTTRDDLAALLGRCVDRYLPGIPMADARAFMAAAADAILTAGWELPIAHATGCNGERMEGAAWCKCGRVSYVDTLRLDAGR